MCLIAYMFNHKVGYAKALDVWVSACILFVFAAVMETMILHLLTRWIPETGSQAHRTDQFELMVNVYISFYKIIVFPDRIDRFIDTISSHC